MKNFIHNLFRYINKSMAYEILKWLVLSPALN